MYIQLYAENSSSGSRRLSYSNLLSTSLCCTSEYITGIAQKQRYIVFEDLKGAMYQLPRDKYSLGVCKELERSNFLSSTFKRTMTETSAAEMAPDIEKQARNMFGNRESRLKRSRLMIAEECVNNDDDGAAYTPEDLVTNKRLSEPLHFAHAKGQLTSARSSYVCFGTTCRPMKNIMPINLHVKDITAAKACFPDFFPQQPSRTSYDSLQSYPTLEDIFSGQFQVSTTLSDKTQTFPRNKYM